MSRWADELGEDYIPSGVCIRNSWTKGMVFTFDFIDFYNQKVNGNRLVKDVWGNEVCIDEVEMILTTSMLKLWDSYNSIEHYLDCCEKNGYGFSITKVCPEKLEDERYLNYQFVQTYELTDEEIDKLLEPTISQFKDILGMDYKKTLLYLCGKNIDKTQYNTNENYIKALMIDKRIINDKFIRSHVYNMIKKQIDNAKTGAIRVRGNYSIISGDPYMFCEFVFGLEPKGLLKANQIYMKYWNDLNVDKVAVYRAPMTNHENICTPEVANTEEMQYWYRYMPTALIMNSHDTMTHELNGCDKDSDGAFTTNNEILVNKKRKTLPIVCLQKSAEKKIPTEDDLYNANINGFGDDIGTYTNYGTSMIQMKADFDKDSEEWKELDYRVKTIQQYQQNAIDKTKGIMCKPMPKEWYDYNSCKIYKEDEIDVHTGEVKYLKDSEEEIQNKLFLQSILADKKPYFMIYIYPTLKNEYNKYMKNVNSKSLKTFGVSIAELVNKENKTGEEIEFIEKFNKKMPVLMSKSLVNKIAWKLEKEFDGNKLDYKFKEFDYNILKSKNVQYEESTYNEISKILKDYVADVQEFKISDRMYKMSKDDSIVERNLLKYNFIRKVNQKCPNKDELCNIVVDLCYKNDKNKQFAWDIAGDTFVKNLLKLNENKITYPVKDDCGDIEYGFVKYKMKEDILNEEEEK